MTRRAVAELVEEGAVLGAVLFRARAQETAVVGGSGEADGDELVVAHDSACCTRFHHGARDARHLALSRAAIDEVADEKLAVRVGRRYAPS